MEPTLYSQVGDLKDDEITKPIREEDPRSGTTNFKLMQVTNRFDEHQADFQDDYLRIQDLALKEKK